MLVKLTTLTHGTALVTDTKLTTNPVTPLQIVITLMMQMLVVPVKTHAKTQTADKW
jgi:hypothetical protein